MKTYKKTPREIYRIIQTFHQSKLSYNLFKCEHIFEGKNSNLDILFETRQDYRKARRLLHKEGYILYMPERVEKYKEMWVKVIGSTLYAIHIHREIAWHNLKILEKKIIFKRAKEIGKGIIVPSDEDKILIHAAHIIFENFKIRKREENIILPLLKKNLDWRYINVKARRAGFKRNLHYILRCIKKGKQPEKSKLYKQLCKRIISHPSDWISIAGKIVKYAVRKLSLKRKGCLISLVGVQGAGKTTLARISLEKYKEITSFFNGQYGYYFGWEPFSFYAKFISKILKKKNKKIFKEINKVREGDKKRRQKFSLKKELIFIYNYLEYLQRYFFVIYPNLRKNKLVITDRYFYDLYGQYNYATKSKILSFLFSVYPKPDHTFLLDSPAETVIKRDKNPDVFSSIKKGKERRDIDVRDIQNQIRKYSYLAKKRNWKILDTTKNIEENVSKIIAKTWRNMVA